MRITYIAHATDKAAATMNSYFDAHFVAHMEPRNAYAGT